MKYVYPVTVVISLIEGCLIAWASFETQSASAPRSAKDIVFTLSLIRFSNMILFAGKWMDGTRARARINSWQIL